MDIWVPYMPITFALAVVAAVGYLFGRRNQKSIDSATVQARRELRRAKVVASELESIAESLRKSLATHHGSVAKFKERVAGMGDSIEEQSWQELCGEAEEMLKPTLELASEISLAYDHIRQQTNHLMTFTEVRTDPLTGIGNRRALDESLEQMLSMFGRYQQGFTISILDIDHFKLINDTKGHLFGDGILKEVARVIDELARGSDILARYGGEEFVVIMPNTEIAGAAEFTHRVLADIEKKLNITLSGGLAETIDGDTTQTILSRADAALYGAKAGGRNQVYYHNGDTVLLAAPQSEGELRDVELEKQSAEVTA